MNEELMDFYRGCEDWTKAHGYQKEIQWAESLDFKALTFEQFMGEYCWTVINSGMKYEVAKKIEERFEGSGCDPSVVTHPAKQRALKEAKAHDREWFTKLQTMTTPNAVLHFLDSLPHIGPITKYQLAQNIGLDVAKPDRWLVRAAARFGYADVQKFCRDIAEKTGQRVRTVDLIIWRYAQANGLKDSVESAGGPEESDA